MLLKPCKHIFGRIFNVPRPEIVRWRMDGGSNRADTDKRTNEGKYRTNSVPLVRQKRISGR